MVETAVAIRKHRPEDLPLVYASWLKSYRFSSAFSKRIRSKTYFPAHHRLIERLLVRTTAEVFIATPEDDPDTILGWLVVECAATTPIVHFAYVKSAFRRLGIATALLQAAGADLNQAVFTHMTEDAESFQRKHPGLSYNPYLAWSAG